MTSWPFVIAAYALVLGATAVFIIVNIAAMRSAERDVEELKRR